MPRWALLVSRDLVRLPDLEEGIRRAGLSPRRVPDLRQAWSLLRLAPGGTGEVPPDRQPAAVVVDLVSLEEEGLEVIRTLSRRAPVVALIPAHLRNAAGQATRWGAIAIDAPHDPERIAATVASAAAPERATDRPAGATPGGGGGPP